MKVSELIKELSKLDQDNTIVLYYDLVHYNIGKLFHYKHRSGLTVMCKGVRNTNAYSSPYKDETTNKTRGR